MSAPDQPLFPELRQSRMPEKEETCTMCGDFCAMKQGAAVFGKDIAGDKVCGVADSASC